MYCQSGDQVGIGVEPRPERQASQVPRTRGNDGILLRAAGLHRQPKRDAGNSNDDYGDPPPVVPRQHAELRDSRRRLGWQGQRRGKFDDLMILGVSYGQRRNQSVAAPRNRLDELRGVSGIPKRIAQPFHRRVQPVLEIDERLFRPEFFSQLFAGNEFAGMCQQRS